MSVPSFFQVKNKKQKAYFRGKYAEYFAALILMLKGYRILKMRYKTHMGEVDIIARRGRVVAFIEVKARSNKTFAIESVRYKQRERIKKAALHYLKKRKYLGDYVMRYDIFAIMPKGSFAHVKNAWQ